MRMRRSSAFGILSALCLIGTTPAGRAEVTLLAERPGGLVGVAAPDPVWEGVVPCTACLGQTADGTLYLVAALPDEGRIALLGLAAGSAVPGVMEVPGRWVASVSRGADDLWVLSEGGLQVRRTGAVEPLGAVRRLDTKSGSEGPRLGTASDDRGTDMALDRQGRMWTLNGGGVRVYVPVAEGDDPLGARWYRESFWFGGWAGRAAAPDGEGGLLVYTPDKTEPVGRLLRLEVEGTGRAIEIVATEADPLLSGLPRLARPRMVRAPDEGLWIAGGSAAGDVLAEIGGHQVRTRLLPFEVSHGRRVTAIEADRQGCVYLATDGAGVLTYRDGEWGVHPITEHLPVLEGSDLKPVDDILVTEDGTVYAACQFQVVIWTPDQP